MSSDRTERPTSRRLQDAQRRGQVARSKDLTGAAELLAMLMVLVWYGPTFVSRLGDLLREGLTRMAAGTAMPVDPGALTQLAISSILALVLLVAPFALTAAATAVGVTTLQGGWNVATEALGLHFERLSPATGVKRLGSRLGIDLVKTLIVAIVIVWLAWQAVTATLHEAPAYGRVSTVRSAAKGWEQAERLIRQTIIALVLFGGADYLVQRWRHTRSLRMTKQEVKDDNRLVEGNPEVKARIRRLQREQARRRMLDAVPKATVVITNPTEYAVALEYRRDELPAPRVVAKGKNALAARIRAIAREHEIPIVENVPLAQALYRSVDVGEYIPADLFGAVAEVLAYLIRLKQMAVRRDS